MAAERLHLTRPLDAWFGDYAVRLVDVTATGALAETDEEIPVGSRALLRFYWRDQEIELTAETMRYEDEQSTLTFVDDTALLRKVIADSANEVLRAQQANLDGAREQNVVGDQTLTAASAGLKRKQGYLTYTFENGAWIRRKTLLPDQPPNGFTVSAGESQEQIDMLCRTYETGDEESRRMMRMLAEISVKAH